MQCSDSLIDSLSGTGVEMLGMQAAGAQDDTTAISRFLRWLLKFEVAKGCFLNGIF